MNLNQQRAAKILKAYEPYNKSIREVIENNFQKGTIDQATYESACNQLELIEKAGKGEGSKGGHVIGHTRSGKAIYDRYNHPGHDKFTEHDHEDAARYQGYKKDYDSKGGLRTNKELHSEEADRHRTEEMKHGSHRHALRTQGQQHQYPGGHAQMLHDDIKRHEANHVYSNHMRKYSKMSDSNRKKYRDQVNATHEVGSKMKGHKTHEDEGRHEGHANFLEHSKHGFVDGDKVSVKNTGAKGKVGYRTGDGQHYVKFEDGSDGHFHGHHLQKINE